MHNTVRMPSPDLLTTRQVADRLGVVPSTVSRMVQRGILKPARKVDGPTKVAWFEFRRADVERLAAARSQSTRGAA